MLPRVKVWLSGDQSDGVFGDGKWRLLKTIDELGSLSAAAATLQISYRKAWGDINSAEKALGVALVVRRRGGAGGGGASLTQPGREFVAAYSVFRTEVDKAVRVTFKKRIAPALPERHGGE